MSIKSTDFAYHEILTDSENIVKDIARLLSLGIESPELKDNSGTIIKPAGPIVNKCWEVVYPARDRNAFTDVEDWNNLLSDEFKKVTEEQISRIDDTVILKTTTLPKQIDTNTTSSSIGTNKDLEVSSITMYLEIYMPKYLCDSENEDPFTQREGTIPTVVDINGVSSGNMRVARNYHHLFMRIFDKPNKDCSGPADNSIDPSTRDVTIWNSRSSNWTKLSWYTDFEEKFKADLTGKSTRGMLDGVVRVPVLEGLTNESKIKLWANVNRSRVILGCMGSPNVDFSDNRYLIGCAYIGQIESFDFSKNDTAGNFGIFATSSTSPAMGRTTVNIRSSKPAIINNKTCEVTPGDGIVGSGTRLEFKSNLTIFNPGTVYKKQVMELTNIPYDYNSPNGGTLWGDRYVDTSTIRVYTSFTAQPNAIKYIAQNGQEVIKSIGIQSTATFSPTVEYDENDRTKLQIALPLKDILTSLIGKNETSNVISGSKIQFGEYYNETFMPVIMNMTYNFSYYTEYTTIVAGVTRDKYGNSVSENYDKTYGKNTATGVTDFAMYATFTKDYFQKHYLYFASTEQYMQKELYGKSVYTDEYFADRIKIVHSSEGPRGMLDGIITIDTSSLNPFDELIVNKDFKKYKDEPEEAYIFLPITAPYCPFANSPNGRHGIGILKEYIYPIPTTNKEIVEFALDELNKRYGSLEDLMENFALLTTSKYGATVTWMSSNPDIIEISKNGSEALVTRPEYSEGSTNPKVLLTASVSCGVGKDIVTKEYTKEVVVRMKALTDSQAVNLDLSKITVPSIIDEPQDIELVTEGENGVTITWSSSIVDTITPDGKVNKPAAGSPDVVVKLTATGTKGAETQSKEFSVTVKPWTKQQMLDDAVARATWDLIKGINTDSQAITNDLVLPDTIGQGVSATWSSDSANLDIATGAITRPTYTQGQTTLTVSCTLTVDGLTKTVVLPVLIIAPLPMTDAEAVTAAKAKLESSIFLGDNESVSKITNNLYLPYLLDDAQLSRVTINWSTVDANGPHDEITSPYLTIIAGSLNATGAVVRPETVDGNASITLKATISCGAITESKYFDLVILAKELVEETPDGSGN